jgi:hypothetical protein
MLDNVAPPADETGTLKETFQRQLAAAFELSEETVFGPDLTLAEVVSASPRFVNSVDFMEACAKVANNYRKTHGVSVRLPATALDTPMSVIVDSFVAQAQAAASARAS